MTARAVSRRAARRGAAGDPFAVFDTPSRVARILAVCTGNVCRSPVIERLLRQRIGALDLGGIAVDSAGTHALVGEDMQPGSRAIVLAHGANADDFRSTSIDEVDLGGYDLVLTASESHRRAVIESEPSLLSRTFPLLGFARWHSFMAGPPGTEPDDTIVDPYRRGADHYHAMERQIVPAIDAVVAHLLQER